MEIRKGRQVSIKKARSPLRHESNNTNRATYIQKLCSVLNTLADKDSLTVSTVTLEVKRTVDKILANTDSLYQQIIKEKNAKISELHAKIKSSNELVIFGKPEKDMLNCRIKLLEEQNSKLKLKNSILSSDNKRLYSKVDSIHPDLVKNLQVKVKAQAEMITELTQKSNSRRGSNQTNGLNSTGLTFIKAAEEVFARRLQEPKVEDEELKDSFEVNKINISRKRRGSSSLKAERRFSSNNSELGVHKFQEKNNFKKKVQFALGPKKSGTVVDRETVHSPSKFVRNKSSDQARALPSIKE